VPSFETSIEFERWNNKLGWHVFVGNNAGTILEISAPSKVTAERPDIYLATLRQNGNSRMVEDNGFWDRKDFVDMLLILFPELVRRAE
jgi:hypothetical protein